MMHHEDTELDWYKWMYRKVSVLQKGMLHQGLKVLHQGLKVKKLNTFSNFKSAVSKLCRISLR